MKKVLITGVAGQDGANMVEYLLKNTDCKVYGMVRRSATPNYMNMVNFKDDSRFTLVYGDLADEVSINNLVKEIQPDYFVNFAANSFVPSSWEMPVQVFDGNTLGVMRCLEAIRQYQPKCRFYSAGSSEEFGDVDYTPQDMKHPIKPRSPYGASKAAARHLVKVYRESYGLYAVHGILFNHEGLKRSEEFVTRKITKGVARIANAIKNNVSFEPIELGNLDAKRDWSDSEDFVDGVWRMLNQETFLSETFSKKMNGPGCVCGLVFTDKFRPKDYILASGEMHSIREFLEAAFEMAGIPFITLNGQAFNAFSTYNPQDDIYTLPMVYTESGGHSGPLLAQVNPKFYRPAEVEKLCGDSKPAREELGWEPKISFKSLVERMVKADMASYKI